MCEQEVLTVDEALDRILGFVWANEDERAVACLEVVKRELAKRPDSETLERWMGDRYREGFMDGVTQMAKKAGVKEESIELMVRDVSDYEEFGGRYKTTPDEPAMPAPVVASEPGVDAACVRLGQDFAGDGRKS